MNDYVAFRTKNMTLTVHPDRTTTVILPHDDIQLSAYETNELLKLLATLNNNGENKNEIS